MMKTFYLIGILSIVSCKDYNEIVIKDASKDTLIEIQSKSVTPTNLIFKIDGTIDESFHMISGATFLTSLQLPKCNNCGPGEFRIKSSFDDPDISGLINSRVVFRYINPTTIKVKVLGSNGRVTNNPNDNLPDQPRVPAMEYTMIKQ
ncbi:MULTISPECIES: DUF6705 family protein [unclassified Chryseobacterium]|uniref:DUF6705 family protein n=1 Tax=unclassified Chryseobacterium TaxID=2593645 RepID=UPI000D3B5B7A|nr:MULTISPECIES: DUF6705 family protein [unclassified Chryseobacterium]PTT71347.1 hypothetical protein DBR25_16835 [Chryseobacterium sp. HMWF001]PVV50755.1 hypothetical protein DD829_21365 [Chryseobacterium sp. HMWF035]